MGKKFFIGFVACLMMVCFATYGAAEELTPQLCKDKVMAAAKLIEETGEQAFETIRDPNGEFRFGNGAGYVWVHDLDGVILMHPIKPSLEGKALLDMRDVNGVYIFAAFNELVEEHGSGWVPYSWPKPGHKESSPKISFVKF
jgi:methyl-accepting chemotaxis protein